MSIEPFTLDSLSASDRKMAVKVGRISIAVLMKALLNRADPSMFKLSEESSALERKAASIVSSLENESFEELRPSLNLVAAEKSLVERFVPPELSVIISDVMSRGSDTVRPSASVLVSQPIAQPSAPHYNNVHMNLRALHCIDEANWGGFEYNRRMYLTSTWIGASGNIGSHKAIFLGKHIDDGDRVNFGVLHLGKWSLNTTEHYPKTFYWNFTLLDSNANRVRSIRRITNAVGTAVQTVAAAAGALPVAAIAAAVNIAVNGILDSLIFERAWPAVGVQVRIRSKDEFGADGLFNGRTGNITSFNGIYRIGYQLAFA